jgi:transcriptional/translational regulatory protein YebC/TACO1
MSKEIFLITVKKYEEAKKLLKEISEELDKELANLGVGTHFQDNETKIVYEIVEPDGTFISYKKLSYNRTKTKEEVKGSLSQKRVTELGYEI